jgi:hypothetical protein
MGQNYDISYLESCCFDSHELENMSINLFANNIHYSFMSLGRVYCASFNKDDDAFRRNAVT